MKNLGKKELIILLIAILIFLSSIGFFVTKTIISNSKPSVYYRTYTKEDGWSKWAKNGEVCGNDHNITALQIKIKNPFLNKIIYMSKVGDELYNTGYVENNNVSGDMKNDIKVVKIKFDKELEKKLDVKYRVAIIKKNLHTWVENNQFAMGDNTNNKIDSVRYIQIKIEKKVK